DVALLHHNDVRVLGGDGLGGVQVAVGGGEDDLGPLADHAVHHPGGVVVLGHVLGGQHLEVGERRFHRLAAVIGSLVVAVVVLRADEDEPDGTSADAGRPRGARAGARPRGAPG